MKYAVIELNDKQYQIKEGQTLKVDSVKGEVGSVVSPKKVLMVSDDDGILIGTPGIEVGSVSLNVISHQKDDKISVIRYRSKSRYRKSRGHRQPKTTLVVGSISRTGESKKAKAKKEA